MDLGKVDAGTRAYCRDRGLDYDAMVGKSEGEIREYLSTKGITDNADVQFFKAIADGNHYPTRNGGFAPFYDTNVRTAGDSAEWCNYFENYGNGGVQKEVAFDLKPYQGQPINLFGIDETIDNKFRASDVVLTNPNGNDIHQEIKVGTWGSNLRPRIRQEFYADALRLQQNPGQKQEYRQYLNAKNGKCMADDKEQAMYFKKMMEKFPGRVEVYLEDKKMSLDDLDKAMNMPRGMKVKDFFRDKYGNPFKDTSDDFNEDDTIKPERIFKPSVSEPIKKNELERKNKAQERTQKNMDKFVRKTEKSRNKIDRQREKKSKDDSCEGFKHFFKFDSNVDFWPVLPLTFMFWLCYACTCSLFQHKNFFAILAGIISIPLGVVGVVLGLLLFVVCLPIFCIVALLKAGGWKALVVLLVIAAIGIATPFIINAVKNTDFDEIKIDKPTVTIDNVKYKLSEDKSYYVVWRVTDELETYNIQEFVEGKPVKAIGGYLDEYNTHNEYGVFGWNDRMTNFVVPDFITYIDDYAFYCCRGLKSITIPSSVQRIGKHAFEACVSLEHIKLPKDITKIEDSTFYECVSLLSIDIPDNLQSIEARAFTFCKSLERIDIPKSLVSIGWEAFYDCRRLNSVYIESLEAWCNTDIESYPFVNYAKLYVNGQLVTDLKIPEGVKTISDYAFYNCTTIKSVTIPDSVTSIGKEAFRSCDSLESVFIPSSVVNIGEYAFRDINYATFYIGAESRPSGWNETFIDHYDKVIWNHKSSGTNSEYEYIIFNDNTARIVEYIGNSEVVNIPSQINGATVTEIYDNAFFLSKTDVKSVTIPNTVKRIGKCAFFKCHSLTSIVIPRSVQEMGKDVFCYCDKVTIYTESYYIPSGWDPNWNPDDRPVVRIDAM